MYEKPQKLKPVCGDLSGFSCGSAELNLLPVQGAAKTAGLSKLCTEKLVLCWLFLALCVGKSWEVLLEVVCCGLWAPAWAHEGGRAGVDLALCVPYLNIHPLFAFPFSLQTCPPLPHAHWNQFGQILCAKGEFEAVRWAKVEGDTCNDSSSSFIPGPRGGCRDTTGQSCVWAGLHLCCFTPSCSFNKDALLRKVSQRGLKNVCAVMPL